jgi:DNA-binding SARP family transcriptional activator/LysM repeat protein
MQEARDMSRPRRHAADLVLDAAVQVLVLAGLPIALWKLAGNPIPTRLPSWLDVQMWWNGVQSYPASALNILPRVVVDALWIAWAWYAAWSVLGVLWELLHLPGVLLPRIMLRLTPRTTVQAITAGAVAAAPAVHAAPALVHTAASTDRLPADLHGRLHLTAATPQHPRTPQPAFPVGVFNHPAVQDAPVHQVVTGDTLWDLAAHYYGDGEQWHRIFNANILRPQPDGNTLSKPDLILPGWKLIIPHRATAAATPAPPTAPGRTTPAASATPTAPGAATPGPAAPHTPASPAPARPGVPAPGGNGRSAPAARGPAADPRTPRTVGWHLPEGGYIGITLIAAIAASTALLRTRKRLHPHTAPPIPASAEQLTAVHDAAKTANAHGYPPDQHGEQIPPPLFKPQPGIPMLGTYPRGTEEAWYDPGLQTGPLVITGPGAEDTVRALALSMLGASDLDLTLEPGSSPIGWEVVLTDIDLARDLFGARPEQHLPGWLHLTDTPAAAVAAFHAAARRRAASGIDPEDFIPSDDEPLTMLIARADPALHDTVVEACLTDPTASLGAILLGDTPAAEHTTTLVIDQDHANSTVTGPRAREVHRLHLYHATRTLAEELFSVLYTAREVYRQPTPPTSGSTPHPAARESVDATAETDNPPVAVHDAAQPGEPLPKDLERAALAPAPADDPRTLAGTPLLLRVLGPVDILGPDDQRPARGERTSAILAALALHPTGLRAPQVFDLAWNETAGNERTLRQTVYSAMRRTRDLLRAVAGQSTPAPRTGDQEDYIILGAADRYFFDSDQISTDIQLRARLEGQADQTADPAQRVRLLTLAAALHRGPLADGLDDNERDWLTIARYEHLLHAAHLHLRIAELAADTDPATVLDHVKQATALADNDEHTRTEAIRLYRQLGRDDLVRALARHSPA